MNYKLLACSVLSLSCINAYDAPWDGAFFAPYDGLYPVSIDSRFEGIVARHPKCYGDFKDVFAYSFKGYVKFGNGFFYKLGTELVFVKTNYISWRERCLILQAGIDVQLGKYWDGIGAVRLGGFSTGPGIGGDYWLVYKDRFKWLTTLEFSGNRIHGCFYDNDHFRPHLKWLNRFFVWQDFYISCGVNHLGDSKTFERARTQGFIGFGSSL